MADNSRRHFLSTAAMTLAGARLNLLPRAEAGARSPRELAAVAGAAQWLNSPPLSVTGLAGKVVAVQFGTYTCINWLSTLPHVRGWAHKYQDRIVFVGVHTPEFGFEAEIDNVRRAMHQIKFELPLALDNDYAIWRAFSNQYWPALYLVDTQGRVRHQNFGEGNYDRSERVIQELLSARGGPPPEESVPVAATAVEAPADWQNLKSPELYLGHARQQNFVSSGGASAGRRRTYTAPGRLARNQWALAGEWTIADQPVILGSAGGRILTRFHARDVHLVMGASRLDRPVDFRVTIDGQPPGPAHGADVDESGSGTVRGHRLYQLIRQPAAIVDRTIAIEFLDAGIEAFAFTFG